MNNIRKTCLSPKTLSGAILALTGVWYAALIINLRGIIGFAGMRFFWTAVLGLGPFLCLALAALLADSFHRNHHSRRLVLVAISVGLSPWLWCAIAAVTGAM